MVISFENEKLVSLADAAKLLPKRRAGKRPHLATLYRWTKNGVKGVTLETIRIGGTTCTSMEAMQRFFERLSDGTSQTKQVEASDRRTEQELKKLGI